MHYKTILFSIVIASLLAACGSSSPESTLLDDTAWTLTQINGQAPAAEASMKFDSAEGTASGSNGCNSYSGSYTQTDETLEFGVFMSTLMGCEEVVAQQEATFMNVLGNLTSFTVEDGQLSLFAGDEVLVFAQVIEQ